MESLQGAVALVVDDNHTNLHILDELLRSWGLVVTAVQSGQNAITELKRADAAGQPYQVVILDSLMPEMDGLTVAEWMQQELAGNDTHTIMLSSNANAGDVERCRKLGIDRYMQKPVVQSDLLETLIQATNVGEAEETSQIRPMGEAAGEYRKLKILLAEDGEVNRQVAIGLLTQQGHEVSVAHDGLEAVAALEEQPFDLVLMDVQMPNMDGHEATRIIRQKEQDASRHTPIVAMTAGAMKGDEEKCLQSGMDAYVSKPFNPESLYRTIERCANEQVIGPSSSPDRAAAVADQNVAAGTRADAAHANVPNGGGLSKVADPAEDFSLVINVLAARQLCRDDDARLRALAETLMGEAADLLQQNGAGD